MNLQPVEYIGPKPRVKKSRTSLGGWFLLLMALGLFVVLLRPLLPIAQAYQSQPDASNTDAAIADLSQSATFGDRLAAAALRRTKETIIYDRAYYKMDYPGGDIPANRGKAEDLIIRSYRDLGVDLQQLVHEHITDNFRVYPESSKGLEPDPNNDHRLAPNLQRFFSMNGTGDLPVSTTNPDDFEYGDIIFWYLPQGSLHTGIVVPGPGQLDDQKWVVHNLSSGPTWGDDLFSYHIVGHCRYQP